MPEQKTFAILRSTLQTVELLGVCETEEEAQIWCNLLAEQDLSHLYRITPSGLKANVVFLAIHPDGKYRLYLTPPEESAT